MIRRLAIESTKLMKRNMEHAKLMRIRFQCIKMGWNLNNANHFTTAKALVEAQFGK